MSAVRVCEEQCATCIFKPGNLMHLRPGRLKDHVGECLRVDGVALCHEVNFGGGDEGDDNPGAGTYVGGSEAGAICRGFFDRYDTTPLQLARRLDAALGGVIEWVKL